MKEVCEGGKKRSVVGSFLSSSVFLFSKEGLEKYCSYLEKKKERVWMWVMLNFSLPILFVPWRKNRPNPFPYTFPCIVMLLQFDSLKKHSFLWFCSISFRFYCPSVRFPFSLLVILLFFSPSQFLKVLLTSSTKGLAIESRGWERTLRKKRSKSKTMKKREDRKTRRGSILSFFLSLSENCSLLLLLMFCMSKVSNSLIWIFYFTFHSVLSFLSSLHRYSLFFSSFETILSPLLTIFAE